jgi:hypothetical protein
MNIQKLAPVAIALTACGLATAAANASTIAITSDTANSSEGLGSFTGTVAFNPIDAT